MGQYNEVDAFFPGVTRISSLDWLRVADFGLDAFRLGIRREKSNIAVCFSKFLMFEQENDPKTF